MPVVSKTWVLVALIALVIAAAGVSRHLLIKDNQRLTQANKSLREKNQQLTGEVKTLQNSYQAAEKAYSDLAETKLQIQTKTRTVIKRIKATPKGDDAPLAPVLKNTLEALP